MGCWYHRGLACAVRRRAGRNRSERESEPMDAAFSQRCSPQFRSAGRPPYPFSKHALSRTSELQQRVLPCLAEAQSLRLAAKRNLGRRFQGRGKIFSFRAIFRGPIDREKRLYYMWTRRASELGGQERKRIVRDNSPGIFRRRTVRQSKRCRSRHHLIFVIRCLG
jgi:hypothetical protein